MDENQSVTGAQVAQVTVADSTAPAVVDPNAAALALFAKSVAPAADPKALAPSASPSGTPEAGKVASAPDTAAPAAAETPEEDQQRKQLSRGFAKLASAKAALHTREQTLKTLEKYVGFEQKVKDDPAALLDMFGSDLLEKLAVAHLKRAGVEPDPPTVESRVEQLEAERKATAEAQKKAQEDGNLRNQHEAREAGVRMVHEHLNTMAAEFPVVLTRGEAPQVFEAVAKYAIKHSVPFSDVTMDLVTTVARAYEDARQAQVDEEFSALAPKVPSIAARLAPPKQETPPATAPSGARTAGAQGSSVTLVGSANEAPPPRVAGRMSREELDAKALEVFKRAGAAT